MSTRTYDFFDESLLARLERLHLVAKTLTAHERGPARRSRRIGDGLEFADHRAYAPGDDIRFIDWPYYARMEKLLLRLFHEHSESEVAIVADVSASMAPAGDREKFDYARRGAAALAYLAMGSLERVTLWAVSDSLAGPMRAGRHRREIFGVLDFLDSLEPGGRTDLLGCIDRFARMLSAPAMVLLLSDLQDCEEDLPAALERLRQGRCSTTVIHVQSPSDSLAAELEGPLLLRHSENGRELSVNVTPEMRQSYVESWRRFCEACERTCISRGASYVSGPTDTPFETLALGALRRCGVVKG